MKFKFAIPLICVLLASACTDQRISELTETDGIWGWQRGEGCEGLKEAIEIRDEDLTWYRDGKPFRVGRIYKRTLSYKGGVDGSEGAMDGVIWTYLLQDYRDGHGKELIRIDDRFGLWTRWGEMKGLTLNTRHIREQGEKKSTRVKKKHDPHVHDRLKKCSNLTPVEELPEDL